ncbi:hypothetical protein QJR36_18110 (plasmid) [Paraclostridium sordellii]|uniref:hypothetical protein n=1 Tax=Paraclostridium sordellii TaxID=1505 RepID=UPI0030CCCB8D
MILALDMIAILVKNTIDKLTKMNLSDNCKLHADQWFQYTIKQYTKMNLSDNCKLHADQWFQYTIKQYSTQLK